MMGIESTPQQPNGDPTLLYCPADGLVHPQSKKTQPYTALESPTHLHTLYPNYQPRHNWMYGDGEEEEEEEEEEEKEEEEEEEVEVEVDDATREKIMAANQRAAEKWMSILADRCEDARKRGYLHRPPLEMLDYPDLFERAWGWDMILPYNPNHYSRFKEYLSKYYVHNQEEANAAGDADLSSLALSCIKMEEHLLFLWNKYAAEYPKDDCYIRLVSEKVTKCAHEIGYAQKNEFPAAAVALKCITKEAHLMCGWLIMENTSPTLYIRLSNEIRHCALAFMVYKGPEYVLAMAAMMGIIKETKALHGFLWNHEDESCRLSKSFVARGSTLGAMIDIWDECSAVKGSTSGITVGECISNEFDSKNISEKKLVENDKLELRKDISQNTEELAAEDGDHGRHEMDQYTEKCSMKGHQGNDDSVADTDKTTQSTTVGSEIGRGERDSTMDRSERRKLRELLLFNFDGSPKEDCSGEQGHGNRIPLNQNEGGGKIIGSTSEKVGIPGIPKEDCSGEPEHGNRIPLNQNEGGGKIIATSEKEGIAGIPKEDCSGEPGHDNRIPHNQNEGRGKIIGSTCEKEHKKPRNWKSGCLGCLRPGGSASTDAFGPFV